MNNQARARLREGKWPKIRDWGLGQTDLTGSLGVTFSPLANFAFGNGLIRAAMQATVGIHRKAPLPKFAEAEVRRRRGSGRAASGA